MKRRLWFILIIVLLFTIGCTKKNGEISIKEQDKLMTLVENLEYFDYTKNGFKVNELSNQDVFHFLMTTYPNFSIENITFKELKKLALKYLNYDLKNENILCPSHYRIFGTNEYLYVYDKTTGTYIFNEEHGGHGAGGEKSTVYNRLKEITIDRNYYIVEVYKVFSDIEHDIGFMGSNYYATYDDAKLRQNPLFSVIYDEYTYEPDPDPQDMLDSYDTSRLTVYTYTFVKKKGNYVLESYEIGK